MEVEQQTETGTEQHPNLLHQVHPLLWFDDLELSVKSLIAKILIIAILIALLYALQVPFRGSTHG